MISKKAESIYLNGKSKKEFLLIHGYTGSSGDFNGLSVELNKKFDAHVRIPLMKGHGTKIEELDGLRYLDFFEQYEKELKRSLKKGRKIILGGYSFGAQIALHLAAKYPVEGVMLFSMPYKLKFPFNKLRFLGLIKKYWKKRFIPVKEEDREDDFFYEYMPYYVIDILREANENVTNFLKNVRCPVLCVNGREDFLSDYRAFFDIEKKIMSKKKKLVLLNGGGHNFFYSKFRNKLSEEIKNFFGENSDFGEKEKVAAVIPAFNEGARIKEVLETIIKTPIIEEVIVVDDGSTDNTREVVKKFKKVKYLKNKKNMGKSYSMDRGVKSTKCPVIFFCDADLNDFTPEISERIIKPVLEKEFDMFIGLRKNRMQQAVKLFALNSGERALRREIWEKLPIYYKHRFRIEAGLNFFAKRYGRGFGYKVFPYYQTLKESKYGFLKGSVLRWWMNFDVGMSYLRAYLFDVFRRV